MQKIDLIQYGINNVKEILYNPSFETLFNEETHPDNKGFEKGILTELNAVAVDTGGFTGRSPKDKFIVKDKRTQNTIWWTSEQSPNDNKPTTPEIWNELKNITTTHLSGKRLFVMDTFCGANPDSRLKVRFITEVAWQAHFVKNIDRKSVV